LHNYNISVLDIIAGKMEGAKSEPNLGVIKPQTIDENDEDNFEENKENFAPDIEDRNIK